MSKASIKKVSIKKGDMVVVVAGKRKKADYDGEPRKVLSILIEKDLVVIEGHRMMKKHIRPNKTNPKGGRIEKEAPVHISNVMLYCSHCEKGVRVGYKVEDVEKKRICRKCDQEI